MYRFRYTHKTAGTAQICVKEMRNSVKKKIKQKCSCAPRIEHPVYDHAPRVVIVPYKVRWTELGKAQ